MFEARTFVKNFDSVKKVLEVNKAVLRGEYLIHDIIYASKDPNKTYSDEFLRLRIVLKNIWDEKQIVVAVKNTDSKSLGKKADIPIKKQFDTEAEARNYIETELLDRFSYDFEFERKGWQYRLNEDEIDLEDIKGHYSVEFKSPTEQGLQTLANLLGITDTIEGTSVGYIKQILKR